MAKKEEQKTELAVEQKKQMASVPLMKVFEFEENTPASEIEETVNPWVTEATFKGKSPMPGKAFSNHKTGKIHILYVYMERIEFPEEYLPKKTLPSSN